MNSLKLRYFSALLSLLSAGSILASCGSPSAPLSDTAAETTASDAVTAAVTEPMDALDARKLADDGLGTYDFGGYEFRVYLSDFWEDYWFAEKETGDIINDAVYQRNRKIGERFNCVIQPTQMDYGPLGDLIVQSVTAGDDVMDLIAGHAVRMGQIVTSDCFYNWNDIPHIDFSRPWWSPSTVRDLTCHGVCLHAIGDAAVSAVSTAYCVFYNKDLGAQYHMPDLYEIVKNGAWTIDRAAELSKDIYVDLNANNEADNEDLYGYTTDACSTIDAYLWAFDNPIFRKEGDELVFSYKTEKISDIIPKLTEVFSVYPGLHTDRLYQCAENSQPHFYARDMFARGLSVFANGEIRMALTHFRDLKDDYGILPYPKWDENQENYCTMAAGHHELLCVPLTIREPERIGVITEAICAENYRSVIPAYFDVALKVKGTRDPESVELLDMITASRIFDFGYIYDGWNGCSFLPERLFGNTNLNFSSYFAKQEKHVLKWYGKVLDYFETYSH